MKQEYEKNLEYQYNLTNLIRLPLVQMYINLPCLYPQIEFAMLRVSRKKLEDNLLVSLAHAKISQFCFIV